MLAKYSYAHEDVAYLNVVYNKIVYDEGNGWISLYTETVTHENTSANTILFVSCQGQELGCGKGFPPFLLFSLLFSLFLSFHPFPFPTLLSFPLLYLP